MKEKPRHALLSGKRAEDLGALAELYEATMGRKPTPEEMDEARQVARHLEERRISRQRAQ